MRKFRFTPRFRFPRFRFRRGRRRRGFGFTRRNNILAGRNSWIILVLAGLAVWFVVKSKKQ